MGKRLKSSKSKNAESFYIIDDFIDPKSKKRSTFVVERLGSLADLQSLYPSKSRDDIIAILQNRVNELREADKIANQTVSLSLSPHKLIDKNKNRLYNLGYLYPLSILNSLGIKKICEDISSQYKFQFNLYHILCDLVSSRIIFPSSKKSSYEDTQHFFGATSYQLEDVYRSLPVLAENRYFIEKSLYHQFNKQYDRNTSVLYYDCTNFYFEAEDEDDFRKYGNSKENRPNPIVQYGLFMDTDGIPLADIVFEGNKNEQETLRTLEKQIEKDFAFSKFVVCADAGLNGWENKVFNDRKKDGAFIVTQPIKKLKKNLKEWALDSNEWKILGDDKLYNIDCLPEKLSVNGKLVDSDDVVFYKDRWEKTTKKTELTNNKYTLEEHIIVSFSPKYRKYQKYIRDKKLERANKLLKAPGNISKNNPRDPRYYIQETNIMSTGEVATQTIYKIDESKVIEEAKFDGFYAVSTNLEDEDISLVIKANKQRWEIEETFEIMKHEFKARPIYVSTEDAIKGHLLICFIALLVYRIFEKKYMKEKYTCHEIIETLRSMNVLHIGGTNYIPTFERTDLIDKICKVFGFQASSEVITQKNINIFLKRVKSKKSTTLN